MAYFHSFTDSIKQKWLEFFQDNRDWITLHMAVESVYTPDGGKRPSSYLILGVLNALEPKLAQLMFPFSKLNPDADTLIEVLELHFDPEIALGHRFIPNAEPENHRDESADHDANETAGISHTNGFGHKAVFDSPHTTLLVNEPEETQNGFDDFSSSNGHNSQDEFQALVTLEAVDEFGDISFDTETDEKLDETGFEDLNSPDENAFSDVLSDVWGDQTSLHKGEENNDFLGEELSSGVFDESEIARLFPNN
ncbi:MAG: DUF5331 domain-containing protein [Gloeotrichia echinulata IR180]|jgi:hypothetical protein|nr:DUF5331 domain-containing protein [Gloeotrichia echinulata DEX184]